MKKAAVAAALLAGSWVAQAARASSDDGADRAYLHGLVHERFGRPGDALSFYEQAAKLDPSSRFLQETLSGLCLRLGRLDEALAAARRAAALAGPDPSAQILLGRVNLARGDRPAAEKAFDQALAVDPSNGEALIYAAYARSAAAPGEAIGFLERYLKDNPRSVEALARIAQLQETLGHKDKAEAFWRQAAERNSSDPDIHAALARLAEARGDRQTALAEYEAARFLDPQDAGILVPLGETYYRLGRVGEAKETLNRALALSPRDTAARFGLALVAEDEKDWDGAAKQMAIVAEDSDQPTVPIHLAYLQSMAGRPRDALKTLNRFRKKDPRNPDLWMYMGLAHEDLGHRRRALKCFRKAVEIDPSRADAQFHLAVSLDSVGKFSDAEPHFLTAIKLDPANAAALNYLGYSWADRGVRLEEALPLIKRAVDIEPENGAFLDSLGWCLFKMGRNGEAEAALAAAVHRAEEADVWEHYGDVLHALGRGPEAVRAWQEGLIFDPGRHSLLKRLGGKGQASFVEPMTAPRAVLKRVEGNFRPLRALAGGVAVEARRGGRSVSVDGAFYYLRPRLFRVEVLGGFLVPAAVVVSNAEGLHAAAANGAAPDLPGGEAWFKLLGDVLSGDLERRFDDPSVKVEQAGSDLVYRSKDGLLRVDGRRKVLVRAEAEGVALSFEDYRDVDGFQLPGSVRAEVAGQGASVSLSFRKLRVNPGLEEALFKTPAGNP